MWLAVVMCIVVLKGSFALEGGETKTGGQEKAASVNTGENEDQELELSVNEERVEETDAEEGRIYPRTNPVLDRADYLTRGDENPENSVPEDLTEELSTALQSGICVIVAESGPDHLHAEGFRNTYACDSMGKMEKKHPDGLCL